MSIDSLVLRVLVGVLASVVLAFFLLRLVPLKWKTHQLPVVGLHLAWALWLGAVVSEAVTGWPQRLAWTDLLGVAGAALWIIISWPSWADGPPTHTETGDHPIDHELSHDA